MKITTWQLLMAITLVGCSRDVEDPIHIPDDTEDVYNDIDTEDAGNEDAAHDVQPEDVNKTDTSDAEICVRAVKDPTVPFQKPEPSEPCRIGYASPLPQTYSCNDACVEGVFERGARGMRDHILYSAGMKEVWLYEGEYLVLDASLTQSDAHWWLPGEFQVIALHEGRYLPIRYIEVDERHFPSMEEIESWPESDYATVQTIYREPFVTFNSTFVIPPWAFPEKGTYNVQLLILPVWREYPDRRFLAERNSFIHVRNSEQHQTMTVYYGSYDFKSHADIEDRQDDAVLWEDASPWGYVQELNLMFLAPPTDRFDWRQYNWVWDEDFPNGELTKEFVFSEPSVTLDFFTVNGGLRYTHTIGQNLYYVLRNEEVIDMFLLEPPAIEGLDAVWEEERGVKLPITFDLTEEMASYKIVVVPEPFSPQREFPMNSGNKPITSNALLMRYEPPADAE
ncbi:hypothetical protein FRC98_06665 [Lujinxingia vulgaris]|uniref:Uncharacterized protein n=1 Tax=Lujinxingia vulgaris TaxID=2600176 RepID=A0A5C6XDL8_9DELT|nr:hypothetical protein [Lujinxingia vulgaris]TXD38558.1 hypothetical protein FRC98_06665 [Lujinxingia vulgaris]